MVPIPMFFAALIALQNPSPTLRASAIIFDMSAAKAADVEPVDPEKNPLARLLTSLEGGVVFDIDGDGATEQIAWTEANSEVAFLAYDKNACNL